VEQFSAMCNLLSPNNKIFADLSLHIRNAIVESALLHIRQLADILLSRGKHSDDINFNKMVPNWKPSLLDQLVQVYGDQKTINSPCWIINKMLAHPTTQRSDSYDYTHLFNRIAPLIDGINKEIRSKLQLT
jgi:hypothetical protein